MSTHKYFNLGRFVQAHDMLYETALKEIKSGKKQSHWMWFIFPQVIGLGHSSIATYYAIADLNEAIAFLKHPLLGEHIREISGALLNLQETNPTKVFGYPDDLKLKSSMTLFNEASPEETVFKEVLNKFFNGEKDDITISFLNNKKE